MGVALAGCWRSSWQSSLVCWLRSQLTHVWVGFGWTEPEVALNVALTSLSAIAMVVARRSVRAGATITYVAVLVFGILFVGARPGSIGA